MIFFAMQDLKINGTKFINDKSFELISLYNNIANNNKTFFDYLNKINDNWNLLSDIVKKLVQNNITNLEQACEMASNSSRLFDIEYNDCIVWDDKLNIVDVIS